jgi:hypothetical protein
MRPDPRRPVFRVTGIDRIYWYQYPTGSKVLLLGVWTAVAEMVALSCTAA